VAKRYRVIRNLTPGHRYAFRVASKRFGGKYGAYSVPDGASKVDIGKPEAFVAPVVNALGLPILDLILVNWTGVGVLKRRFDLDEYRVYRTRAATEAARIADCNAMDAKIATGEDPSTPLGRVVAESKALFFIDVGYDEDNPTKNQYGPREDTTYYYLVRGIGKDGLLGLLSIADNAILGPPEDITDLSFEEDIGASFFWLKGWKVKWTPSVPAEAYRIQHRTARYVNGVWIYGLWNAHGVHEHDTTVEEQSFTIPFLVVGKNYQVRVMPINHLLLAKYWGNWYTESTIVSDAGSPSPPEVILVQQGPWNNKITWQASPETDVAYYEIYKREDGDEPTLSDRRAIVPHTAWNHYWDIFAGKNDARNWHYSIKAVDWFNNKSVISDRVPETGSPEKPQVVVNKFILGNFVHWSWEITDKHYDLYRSTTSPVEEISANLMKDDWRLPFFFDFGQVDNFPRVRHQEYFYVVKVTKMNLATALSDSVGGIPDIINVPGPDVDVDGNAIINLVSSNTIAGKINTSSITIRPTAIEMKSGGDITLAAGRHIYLSSTGGILWENSCQLYTSASLTVLRPYGSYQDLYIGLPSHIWDYLYILSEHPRMRLYKTGVGYGTYELFIDASGFVKGT